MQKTILVSAIVWFAAAFNGYKPLLADNGNNDMAGQITQRLQTMEMAYPQQKIFLHTDKEEYLAGETIWFKAYAVHATTHRPDTMSTNLHVNLINNKGDVASILLLRLDNGVAHGDIALPDSLSEGNYQFVAYTDWMHNFDPRFFFKKDIYVHNPIEENFIRRSDVWRNRRFNRRLSRARENMQFAVFPEGGHMFAGTENTVAFKAANELGAGVKAYGTVRDDRGNEVVSFSTLHNGMGSFMITPEAGREYTARVVFDNGDRKTVDLPEPLTKGLQLAAVQSEEEIQVRVLAPGPVDWPGFPDQVYVVGQSRGRVHFVEKGNLNAHNAFRTTIPLETLPTGIYQIALVSGDGVPLAERLVFVNKGDIDEAQVVEYGTETGDTGRQMTMELMLDAADPPAGSYSLAVVDATTSGGDYSANIASEFLLFSDLGYRAENPWFYLHPGSEKAAQAADLVMLTHGWTRFDLEQILNEEYPEITHGFPEGITIRGSVSPRSSARKTGEVNVELSIEQDERIYAHDTTTDEDGLFVFPNLYYDGFFTASLRIDTRFDKRAMDIRLGERDYREMEYDKNFSTRVLQVTARGDDWKRTPRPETVIKKRGLIEPGEERTPSMFANADQVIYFDDIRDQYNSVIDVLRTRVRGLRITGGEITLRGPSSLFFTNEPLFLIDETVVSRGAFLGVNVRQIDRLAVISGPQSAILGSRGTNGALLIYTLRGDSQWHRSYEYKMKGFHQPSETFASKIDTDKYARHDIDRTLYWEPHLSVDEQGFASVVVPYDENVRNKRLIIQGIDKNGRITFYETLLNNDDAAGLP